MTARRRFFPPTIARHLAVEVGRTATLTFAAFLSIFILAEFFDRFDTFLQNAVPMGTVARSFLFKLPIIVTQVTPMAVLAGALIGLGLLASAPVIPRQSRSAPAVSHDNLRRS